MGCVHLHKISISISRVCRQWYEKYKLSSEQQFSRWKSLLDVRGDMRIVRVRRSDRQANVAQITTHHNQGMQKTCPAFFFPQRHNMSNLKTAEDCNGCHFLSIRNRKLWLQLTQADQNQTTEDYKNITWSDKS